MPGKNAHILCGAAVGIATFFALGGTSDEKPASHGLTTALAGVAGDCLPDFLEELSPATIPLSAIIGSRLPDLIEPATSPNHRQFFHSWLVFGATAAAIKALCDWKPLTPKEQHIRRLLISLLAGYSSHLFLDALTTKSLPFVGNA